MSIYVQPLFFIHGLKHPVYDLKRPLGLKYSMVNVVVKRFQNVSLARTINNIHLLLKGTQLVVKTFKSPRLSIRGIFFEAGFDQFFFSIAGGNG
jgi:hypothetical protein